MCMCVAAVFTTHAVKEYDAWLRLLENRSVHVMASLDCLEWCKMHNTQFPTIAKLARMYLHGYSSNIRSIRERSVFKSHFDPGATAMEAACTSPTAGGINYAKAQSMDASKEISQYYCSMYYK